MAAELRNVAADGGRSAKRLRSCRRRRSTRRKQPSRNIRTSSPTAVGSPCRAGPELRVGSKGGAVEALRQRLVASGDLDPVAGSGQVYDSFVEAGVKRFQARNGLNRSGVVNKETLAALNVLGRGPSAAA